MLVDPVSAIVHELGRGEYREVVRSRDGLLTMGRPFPVEVELAGAKS